MLFPRLIIQLITPIRWGFEDVDLMEKFQRQNMRVIRPKLKGYFHLQRKGEQLLQYRIARKNVYYTDLPRAPAAMIFRSPSSNAEVHFLLEAIQSKALESEIGEVKVKDVHYYPSIYAGSSNGCVTKILN
jgi:hypothetical protein